MPLFRNLFPKPLSARFTVTSSNGFHLRPVAQFSTLARTFPCRITATFKDKTVDAKSVSALLSLSLEQGDSFTLAAKGKESHPALEKLQLLFETLMQHDTPVQQIKKTSHCYQSTITQGESISEGIAIAPAYRYSTTEIQHKNTISFKEALHQSIADLETLSTAQSIEENAGICLAQKELLSSLAQKSDTLTELEKHVDEESKKLSGTALESKRSDYRDILRRVKKHLGLEVQVVFPDTPFILLCDDLLPSDIETLAQTKVAGVILKESSLNSHAAILLRAAGICSIIADTTKLTEDEKIILDTYAGVIVQNPSGEDLEEAKRQQQQHSAQKALISQHRFEPAISRQGKQISVVANVSDPASAKVAKEEGAEGIGLLRSEFLFTSDKPSVDTQQKAYKEIFALFDDVTVRTLDVGGDKALSYIQIPSEDNPFLGIRGVRLFKTHPELLEEQLYAIFTAAGEKRIKIMFPMVSTVEEFIEAKSFAQEVAEKYALDISRLFFGIMIEVPSVLFLLEAFNEVVDFYSIGTNDLTQYLFATERTHPLLKTDELSPVIFSAIQAIIKKSTKPVSICGELAADKNAIPALVKLGISTLSVSPKRIADTKEAIRHV